MVSPMWAITASEQLQVVTRKSRNKHLSPELGKACPSQTSFLTELKYLSLPSLCQTPLLMSSCNVPAFLWANFSAAIAHAGCWMWWYTSAFHFAATEYFMIGLWFARLKKKKKHHQNPPNTRGKKISREDKSGKEKKKQQQTHTVIGRKIQIPNGIP